MRRRQRRRQPGLLGPDLARNRRPPVQRPTTLGLGSELIGRSLDFELGGAAATEYREDGVVVTLTIPVEGHHIMVEGNGGS